MTLNIENAFEEIPEIALSWHKSKKGAILATVIETWGSAPRRIGAQLVISSEGEMEGSVSGGCVEGEVLHAALGAMESGKAQVLNFGVADKVAWSSGLSCGGEICVFVCSYLVLLLGLCLKPLNSSSACFMSS